ncbi:N-formylglutamate amidohydrolase [Sediminibacter sp. Hel_I_10]|uniref:N-formylglutamate amidohydrolase n=1 Tax=Sediminibacter sp. Hel_I_10 TaxID=1392490 RepID=UPI00047B62D1|nr:N-formylglutamate amidohydrolase [Sediminibacter sp. Hel_I_10]
MRLVLTCEHGGNDIPETYKERFPNDEVLKTHRGYDLGALDVFQYLKPLSDVSFYSTTSRLFVELNRSLHHPMLFSEFTKHLSKIEKDNIIKDYYLPYRFRVEDKIRDYINHRGEVLHLSIHSFTPQLNGKTRNCDIGLLYDSQQKEEQEFCKHLKTQLLKHHPNLNVRFNYPYLGKADGFTTFLRKQFSKNYIGIEIELNQKFVAKNIIEIEIKEDIYKAISGLKSNYHVFKH